MKFWKLALLAAVGLALSTQAVAGVSSMSVKSDTTANFGADSSAVINVSNAARLWLDFIAVPLRPGDFTCDTAGISTIYAAHQYSAAQKAAICDSFCTAALDSLNAALYDSDIAIRVQAREVLNIYSGCDTVADSSSTWGAKMSLASAYSDTTVIPWTPRATWINGATTAMAGDTVVVNRFATGDGVTGSSEIRANILARTAANWSPKRVVRVDFINPQNGVPFRAQFASFRWRVTTNAGPAETPTVRLRVVLGRETW